MLRRLAPGKRLSAFALASTSAAIERLAAVHRDEAVLLVDVGVVHRVLDAAVAVESRGEHLVGGERGLGPGRVAADRGKRLGREGGSGRGEDRGEQKGGANCHGRAMMHP